MKRFFDKVLLGILWLITVVLATTFWMNIKYGFNILSAAHWAYLSELQAQRTNIKFDFYLSLIIAIAAGLIGLYLIVRPRFRKIVLTPPAPQQVVDTNAAPVVAPAQHTPLVSASHRPMSPSNFGIESRNTGASRPQYIAPTPQIAPTQVPQIEPPQNPLFAEIAGAFESAGYIIKNCTKIGELKKPVFALDFGQTIWIGASNVSPALIQTAIESLIAIFDDTLGDTAQDITLRGCIVNPTDTDIQNPDLITTFNNIDELKNFIDKNTKPDDFDTELFDAFSTYIDTVLGYIGK